MNAKIEKFINRRKAKGQEHFPDFADVLKLFKAVNAEKGLCLSPDMIDFEGEEIAHFERCKKPPC